MNHQGLNICHICQEREYLQMVDERMGLLLTTFDIEGEYASATIGEVLLIQGMVRMIRQRRMVDLGHLRMLLQELDNLLRVLGMTLKAEGESLSSLQQEECCEWRDSCSLISEQDGSDVGDKGCRAYSICK